LVVPALAGSAAPDAGRLQTGKTLLENVKCCNLGSMRTIPHDSMFDVPQRPQDPAVRGRTHFRPLPSQKEKFGKEKVKFCTSHQPLTSTAAALGKEKVILLH